MEIPENVCFSTFQPNCKSVEESSNRPRLGLAGNSNLAKSVLVSTSFSDVSTQINFGSTGRWFFNGLKDGKTFINKEKKIKSSGLDNFREKLLAGGISKNVAELITIAKRQGSITLYELTWDSCCSRKQVNLPSGLITYFFSWIVSLRRVEGFSSYSPVINTPVLTLFLNGVLIKED